MTGRPTRFGPAEGWLSVALVIVLCITLAWAIDDVALVLGRADFTDFLVPMSVLGVLVGVFAASVGWGRPRAYLIGSTFAALIVPIVVGGVLEPGAAPAEAFRATAQSAVQAATDLLVLNRSFTTEYGHYLWVLGLLVWGTSMFASYATFGRHRPLDAIAVVGLVLLVNMALTTNDQLPYLVIFSIVALLLLVRSHVFDERAEWVRRRIGDPASVTSVYLRGGAVFVVAAVAGSVLLTDVARSAPLASAWAGANGTIVELSRAIQKFLPTGGNSKSFGADFNPDGTSIRGIWNPGDQLELTITVPTSDKTKYYWRAVTWDQFTGNGWSSSPSQTLDRTANAAVLDGSEDAADPTLSDTLTFSVDSSDTLTTVFSPLTPQAVSEPVAVNVLGADQRFGSIVRAGSDAYTVTALLRKSGDQPGELSQAALRAAGTDYPDDIVKLYTSVPDGAIPAGGYAAALLDQLSTAATQDGVLNPYDFAAYLESRFRVSGPGQLFEYTTNLLDLYAGACKDVSTVECFAHFRRGFCQYYATTMAIFLREKGIPARVVEGFLPGDRVNGVEKIYASQSHEWVEVYFPGYGWYTFDPTGGGLSVTPTLPVGVAGPTPSPTPSRSFGPIASHEGPEPSIGTGGGTTTNPTDSRGPLAGLAILLAVLVGGLAFLAWQRGPRGATTPERAYRTVTRLAGRFGFGPRPDQTVFEYAAALGEVLPMAKPELHTIADAKVVSAYGRGTLGDDALRAVRQAERQLRVRLLRLAFLRRRRRPH